MSRKWERQKFMIAVSRGGGKVEPMLVDGWVCHPFAVDKRYHDGPGSTVAWCITHLPTGYGVKHVKGRRALAQKVADDLARACNWNFTDPLGSKGIARFVRPVFENFDPDVFADSDDVFAAAQARPDAKDTPQ